MCAAGFFAAFLQVFYVPYIHCAGGLLFLFWSPQRAIHVINAQLQFRSTVVCRDIIITVEAAGSRSVWAAAEAYSLAAGWHTVCGTWLGSGLDHKCLGPGVQ